MISSSGCGPAAGYGSIQLVAVPVSMIPGASGGGSSSGAGPAAGSVAYVPQAGSPLVGSTTAGAALDTIGNLLKLLNNAGFATAADGTIPVYNAATGKFIPTAAADLLAPADLDALLKALYATGAPGAILQIAPDGTVDAVPFLTALKAGTPGATTGQILKFDGTNWVLAAGAPDLSALFTALSAGTIANVVGTDAAGNAVKQSPQGIYEAAILAALPSTTAAPISRVSGITAAGAAVDAQVRTVGTVTNAQSTVTSNVLGAAGNAVLVTVTVPTTGLYAIDIDLIVDRAFTAAYAPGATLIGFAYHAAVIFNQANTMLYHSGTLGLVTVAPGSTIPAGTTIASGVNRGTVLTTKLTAGNVLRLELFNGPAPLTFTHGDPANLILTKLADTDILVG